jgi:hypothetical protein
VLHKALSDAVKRGRLKRNPADAVWPPTRGKASTRWWSVEELRAFLQHVQDDELYAAWLIFATTGSAAHGPRLAVLVHRLAGADPPRPRLDPRRRSTGPPEDVLQAVREPHDGGRPPSNPRSRLEALLRLGRASATGWHEAKVISQRLGHANVGITLDTYSHVLPAADETVAHTLANMILRGE